MTQGLIALTASGLFTLSLGACRNMSIRDKNTAAGSDIGGGACAGLNAGSTAGTVAA